MTQLSDGAQQAYTVLQNGKIKIRELSRIGISPNALLERTFPEMNEKGYRVKILGDQQNITGDSYVMLESEQI